MAFIIGMDFGNYCSFPSYIDNSDLSAARLGGKPIDLLPNEVPDGYPSVFFYSQAVTENCRRKSTTPPPWYGQDAVRGQAKPASKRVKNFKRHMNEPLHVDDLDTNYDDLITGIIQYLMRHANEQLKIETLQTTNLLSLAYPATFTASQRLHLKNLAEKATLSDGTHIKVVGMIAEPAAAALDYLVEHGRTDKETTVLVYDLGGGTFDLSIVTAYPQGRKAENSDNIRYFDINATGGLKDLGGTEFDAAMLKILEEKVKEANVTVNHDMLERLAETAKWDLSDHTETEVDIIDLSTGESVTLEITRSEFEEKTASLMKRTVDEAKRFLDGYQGPKPEMIILTGGSSKMPMVQRELEKAFPQFAGSVQKFRPSRAISYGAARYSQNEESVQQHVTHDIGIQFYRGQSGDLFVDTYIPAGTELPFESRWNLSHLRSNGPCISEFSVMEAKINNPNPDHVDQDYLRITTLEMEHGPDRKMGDPTESRMILDNNGLLHVEARDPSKPGMPPVKCEFHLKNLS